MSYCRAYDDKHQVYLYGDCNGMFCCCGCKLIQTVGNNRIVSIWLADRTAAILHLRHHRLAGHKFPRRAERRLMLELKKEGERFIKYDKQTPCEVCSNEFIPMTKYEWDKLVRHNTAEFEKKFKIGRWTRKRPKESYKRYFARIEHHIKKSREEEAKREERNRSRKLPRSK